jgi:TRAP transporter TAXI family solute receptor
MRLTHNLRTLPALALVAATLFCSRGTERKFINVGTAPPGGAFFVVGSALTEVMGASSGDRNWQVTAEGTSGSQENIRRLTQGDLDFALSNSAITYFAVRGGEGWDRQYPMRTVMTLAPNVALFISKADSSVNTIADLKGKRVVIGPAGAGFEYFVKPILEAHGVRYEDFTALNASQTAAVDMLTDGSAAAIFIGGAIPTASITQAAATMDLRFIPFDEAARAKLSADFLFFAPATIPADTYRGQTAAFQGLDVGSMHLVTAEGQDEKLVYEVTKLLWEQREAVTQKHPAGRAINPKNVIRDTGTPFHPGAIRFYRDIGIWPK